ncbi:hypothetical protein [Thalassotalea castellviae]|uniref:VCBS repeat-containing protein n=1 Tax=Thalassotalea castellviae TaxID=3075612 RepID=A0ABU3A4J7_9GAMM|nr:hypothetical protein [Thalassotalea sp. W431]MDT0604730.1 hypothetical protein [Thalassotalea sp. W431]
MSVNSTAITTKSINQHAQYQQTFAHSRKLTVLDKPTASESKQAPFSDLQSVSVINQALMIQIKDDTNKMLSNPPSKNETQPTDTYDRPLTPKVELLKIILEGYFGKEFGELFSELDFQPNNESESTVQDPNQENNVNSSESEQVNIDGIPFYSSDLLKVEQWQHRSQSLNYQMNGEFNINGQHLKMDYSFAISTEQTSYSSIEMTAAALKDPLVVQFGKRSIGEIKDHHSFDINRDGNLDNLPVFSGDVGYLVYDKNQNLKADDGSELFGPQTGHGFNELAELDSNGNGFIDNEDEVFEHLYLWQPEKSNNMLSLSDANILAINTSAIDTPFSFYDTQGNIMAEMRRSSFAISTDGVGKGVHQIDVRI